MELKQKTYQLAVFAGFIILQTLSTGCASQGKSIGFGGLVGAGAGAALGGIVNPGKNGEYRTRNVIIGAAAGGLAGSLTAAAVHENTEKEKEIAYLKGRESKRSDTKSPLIPTLEDPKVEAEWVESKVIGNKYIEGHFEYIIKEPIRWENPR